MHSISRLVVVALLIGAVAALLAGCAHTPATTHETVIRASVPVPQPCVRGTRPTIVVPLNQQITADQWAELDVKQKAAHVGKQGLERQTYGEQLNAATGACS